MVGLQPYFNTIMSNYHASFEVPLNDVSRGLKGSVRSGKLPMQLDDMKKVHRPDHGTFYFGPTSDEVMIPQEFVINPIDNWCVRV